MNRIGFLSKNDLDDNLHMSFLKEKGWMIDEINVFDLEVLERVKIILIKEDTMAITCYWLMELVRKFKGPIYLLTSGDSHSNIVYLRLGVKACFPYEVEGEELFLTLSNLIVSQSPDVYFEASRNYPTSTELQLIHSNSSVLIDGSKEIMLTRKEFQLLDILYANPKKAITYDVFAEKLWGEHSRKIKGNYRIANVVFSLRNKIEKNIDEPKYIKTVRSKGYMLSLE